MKVGECYTWQELTEAGYAHIVSYVTYDVFYGHGHWLYVKFCEKKWLVTQIHNGGY